jgi:hypothetical protein
MENGSNPNESVGMETSIEVRGQSPSFDEMEHVTKEQAAKNSSPKPEPQEKLETKPEKPDNKSNKKSETNKEPVNSDAKTSEEPVKFLKAKYGEQEIELAPETLIPTKVAGKLESPTLTELQQNYSGKINWERKYSELAKERGDFDSQKTEMNTLISAMVEATKEDPFKFYDVIGELTGSDALELKMAAIDEQIAMARKLGNMSPEQVEAFKKHMAMQFREDTLNRKETRYKDAENKSAEQKKLTQIKSQFNINDDDYSQAEKVAKEYVKDRTVTTEDVVTVSRHLMVLDAIEDYNTALSERGDYHDLVNRLRDEALKNPGYTKQDITDILQAVYGDTRAKNLSKKIRDSEKMEKGKVRTFQNEKRVLHSFDQL